MLAPLVALTLAAAPFSITLPGLNAVRLEHGEGELYSEALSQKLMARGFKVITNRDIGAMLGLERQKQLMQCGSDNCTAELTAALGADALLTGDVGLLGAEYVVNLKLIAAKDGAVVAVFNGKTLHPESVLSVLDAGAQALAAQVARSQGRSDLDVTPLVGPAVEASSTTPWRTVGLVTGGAGVAAVATGAVLLTLGNGKSGAIASAPDLTSAQAARDAGKAMQTSGVILIAVGASAAVAGVAAYFFGGSTASPAVAIVPGGVTAGVSGVW
ncbi:MAG: hypothetical protein K1X89_30905 [Myxococcaceae bacterium]|nr:hypothetical protein [Myxococcaceae bacterium]